MTLADLRTLLTLARGPAVERVPRPTIDRLGYRYLPRSIWLVEKDGSPEGIPLNHAGLSLTPTDWLDRPLDLTDPGTVHALKVALALALGLDPGPLGVSCGWGRTSQTAFGYLLTGAPLPSSNMPAWLRFDAHAPVPVDSWGEWYMLAPEVAAEPDPIKALVLACEHVARGAALTSPPSPG